MGSREGEEDGKEGEREAGSGIKRGMEREGRKPEK